MALPIEAAARTALEAEGVGTAEISVSLLDDPAIAGLHERYLGVHGPTDVLSFNLDAEGAAGGSPEGLLGDIYIGFETAASHAEDRGIGLKEELTRLTIHGVLHILGHDHPSDEGREGSPMYLRQEELLRLFLDKRS
ncbi:MAG: rRNA maturation RNase YbeY [Longimicrobiales bacterium]